MENKNLITFSEIYKYRSWFDLTSYLSIDWDSLHDIICRELSTCPYGTVPAQFTGVMNQLREQNLPNTGANRKFVSLLNGSLLGPEIILLVGAKNNIFKNGYLYPGVDTAYTDYFPRTMAVVRSLPFDFIGRVTFFLSPPGVGTPPHKDNYEGGEWEDFEGNFISLNPSGRKTLWIEDSKTPGFPTLVNSKAYTFHTGSIHGTHPYPYGWTYTLRVDGKLKTDFCAKLGIKN